ncbi:MAG: IPT/TIG domain-containing protein, partial [Proteobacteria bacterium]|nr:IPT/TIG domain-containing protein [Pseudomonadota bacterium]
MGACGERHALVLPELAQDGGAPAMADGALVASDALLPSEPDPLVVVRLVPSSGPFTGGNRALVRGSGFGAESLVEVGGRQATGIRLIDSHRLSIVLPAGEAGEADVVVRQGSEQARLDKGYIYNALRVEPASGPVAGGTLVEIFGRSTAFADGDRVVFGDAPCRQVEVITSTRIRCKTPSNPVGHFDVLVISATNPNERIVALQAFEYTNPGDAFSSGLSGGPIAGSINLTVRDAFFGRPVPGAFAMVDEDLGGDLTGRTDPNGQLVFSAPGLKGPRTIHVAKKCFENGSIVGFDARDVTLFLRPQIAKLDRKCGKPEGAGGRSTALAHVSGELVWPSSDEFHLTPWSSVPEPRPGETRVAYVFTTRAAADSRNPPPGGGDSTERVVEGMAELGKRGHRFRIRARSAALAVYALAGTENVTSGEFTPYAMGVARAIITAPGSEVPDVAVPMDIALDDFIDVELVGLPASAEGVDDLFEVEAFLDLGAEGLIVRQVGESSLDRLQLRQSTRVFRFFAQPALQGPLADALYYIRGGHFSEQSQRVPFTVSIKRALRPPAGGRVRLDDFLGIPRSQAPSRGEPIPGDRVLRWSGTGDKSDAHYVSITGGDGHPAWRLIVAGTQQQA